ncbi:MAG: hypothetical protein K5930_07785 [Treponemataceae bacterium]|nr:hypothetical protein [Treponemataceae bacterium]
MLKKLFLFLGLIFSVLFPFFSEGKYKINKVTYDISGITRESVLSQNLNIDTSTIFESSEDFYAYLETIKQNIENYRVIESSEIIESFSEENEEGLIYVDLIIKTVDSLNFVIVPYPTYDVNTGFKLKLKIKDYNFLGSMDEFNSSLIYFLKIDEDSGNASNYFDFSFGFDVPFQLGLFNCKWNNAFSLNYVIGDSNIGFNIKEGIDFSAPIYNITTFNFNLSQSFIQNPALNNDDLFHFNTSASLSLPFNIAQIPNVGYLTWAPGVSFNFNWDKDIFLGADDFGITTPYLLGPVLTIFQRLSVSRVNWIENYKDGFSTQVNINYSYNFTTYSYDPNINMQLEYYKAYTKNSISSRLYYFINTNGQNSPVGDRIRGIRDNDISSASAFCLNIDVPIKLFQTDWVGWLKNATGKELNWLAYVDFEAQISPFFDFIIGHNSKTGSFFNFRDAHIASGFEILGFPNKFRSIQGRVSFGMDLVKVAMFIGENVNFVNNLTTKIFNTSWRKDPWWELFFGIGLFY